MCSLTLSYWHMLRTVSSCKTNVRQRMWWKWSKSIMFTPTPLFLFSFFKPAIRYLCLLLSLEGHAVLWAGRRSILRPACTHTCSCLDCGGKLDWLESFSLSFFLFFFLNFLNDIQQFFRNGLFMWLLQRYQKKVCIKYDMLGFSWVN